MDVKSPSHLSAKCYFLKIWAELIVFIFLEEQQERKSLKSCGTTVVLITWADSISSYEYFNMGKLKQEFDNATCPESLAFILSIYVASQIEVSSQKARCGRENPNCSNISSPFPSLSVSSPLSLFQFPSPVIESQLRFSLSLMK